ncbi:hypothetical protein VC625_04605 [Citrobacter freundii]|uniref:hypothetical protein n=1 Tax=Citrobacter freundii TaxID=546 RepID=UPI000D024333|nr:hypothetical protein [Citrobacter freundii]MBJ8786219.1 hypothetical protein [Citrobacter freundii]MDV0654194.1 hypothetical protein [Citrobacter freundii]MDV0719961.1 hypothetical protein [Citrobacter freundii]MEB0614742.1 hypothetical protein [Citrobacter freundii]MEB0689894.1 hypothetical protein [Citrobacter freundii]
MAMTKSIILGVLIAIASLIMLQDFHAFTGVTVLVLIVLKLTFMMFTFRYAMNHFPYLSFVRACSITMLIAIVGFLIRTLHTAVTLNVDYIEVARFYLARSAVFHVLPVATKPLTLALCRWIFSEERTVHLKEEQCT